ncbi:MULTISPECIES: GIY-YIG nuclease family protein [Lysinibacillus]|uniref:GIY-YIG nuclease family protein n=1 Tax=Lysinibacillus TaxID=400634 RepID=UPI00214BD706|nr:MULTISPECIES: GIY-YIG nuclease family protein [Lysinibacillus]UUV23645.1 GIY-YIG nuclease family protein [Lysinibacillus sp. FN11]UYB46516.1 GIY-YIG nuclease family protein [Lysinibacillus capsici]
MQNRYNSIQDILSSDLFDELTFEEKKEASKFTYDLEVEKFIEIVNFVKENEREPYKTLEDLIERKLASRLQGIRKDSERKKYLKPYDEVGLLDQEIEDIPKIESVEDILNNASSGLLDTLSSKGDSIFDVSSLPKTTTMPDYIAKRKKVKNFSPYEPLFKQCHLELTEGKRVIKPFKNGQDIHPNSFYLLKGVLVYVEQVGELKKVKGSLNARLRCIFENGTESDMLLRSLAAELYKHGRRITENEEHLLDELENANISSGHIYVLKSLSNDPQIKGIKNLYKIGYTKGSVEKRISNAENESTFLYAPVGIVAVYEVFNMSGSKFETALHHVLAHKNLDVSILGVNGKMIVPKEWFVISLEELQEAINQIVMMVNLYED